MNSIIEPTARGARPPPSPTPPPIGARPPLPCAVASHTDRKQSTCFARPQATARQASITEPSCPGSSIPPVNQFEVQAQRVVHVRDARAREARRGRHHARIGREPVDVLAREPGVFDRREAGVERQLERIAIQAPADVALPDSGDRRAPLENLRQASTGSKSGR